MSTAVDGVPSALRRLGRIAITPELLVAWFQRLKDGRAYVVSGLPDEIAVVGASYDAESRRFQILVEGPALLEHWPGQVVNELSVSFQELPLDVKA